MRPDQVPVPFTFRHWKNALGILLALATAGAVILDQFLIAAVPLAVLFIIWAVYDPRAIFGLYFLILPFSIETQFSNGLGTDLPTEPIMLGLAGLTILFLVKNIRSTSGWLVAHPISLALWAHLAWIGFTVLFSVDTVVSVKYLLAKSWYVLALYVLAWLLVDDENKLRRLMALYLGSLMIVILYTLVRHTLEGFTFVSSNFVMAPFYRNHVNYGAALTLAIPLVWAFYHNGKKEHRWRWVLYFLVLFVAIWFAYLRAAYVAMIAIAGTYYIVRYRLMRPVILLALIAGVIAVAQLIQDDKYLEFAPDYEKTIAHKEFDDLISATTKGEDISTMERVYRWVAGYQMIRERTWLGFGPGCFYENYKPYAVNSFETYVSDNPDKSGVHSYYLMTVIEQGLVGLVFFLILVIVTLVYGERLYHLVDDPVKKRWVMAMIMVYVGVAVFQIINDLVETDKIGTFFFLAMAVIARWSSQLLEAQKPNKRLAPSSSS